MKKFYDEDFYDDDCCMQEKKITIDFKDCKKPECKECKPVEKEKECCEERKNNCQCGIPIDMKKCEETKDLCLMETCDDNVRILKINVHMENLCPNRKINVAVQLFDCDCDKVISQKGKTMFTGHGHDCCNKINAVFYFAIVGNLCDCMDQISAKVVANYISDCDCGCDCDCDC